MIEKHKFYSYWKFKFLLDIAKLIEKKKCCNPSCADYAKEAQRVADDGYPKETGACDEINTVIQSKGWIA